MSNIKFINTGKKELCLVNLPKEAINIQESMGYLVFKEPNYKKWCSEDVLSDYSRLNDFLQDKEGISDYKDNALKLPKDHNYKLIAPANEITEEQACELVKYVGHPWCAYEDYTNIHNWFSTALESFKSLLQANECVDGNWIFLKVIK